MSVLMHLQEALLSEDRFEFVNPDSYKYNGNQEIHVTTSNGVAMCQATSTYDFRANDTDYTLILLTSLTYDPILTDNGEISYHVENNMIRPIYTNDIGEKTPITDEVMSSELGREITEAVKTNTVQVSINRAFDVAHDDPSKSDEDYATTNKGKVIPTINKTYTVLKHYLDNFTKYIDNYVTPVIFDMDYMAFVDNYVYELETITFVAKPDYDGDTRRANLYYKWWKAMGSQMGNVEQIQTHNTKDGVEFSVLFTNTGL